MPNRADRNDGPLIRRILILGHTGYIGSRVLDHFRRHAPHLPALGHSISSVDLRQPERVASLAPLVTTDTALIVCAAVKKQLGDTPETLNQNLQIAINLCRLLEERLVARVVLLSSAAVYGEDVHNTSITEDTPVQPRSYYGIGKFTTECLLRKALGRHAESSLLILRPALVYGPAESGIFYGPSGFLQTVLRGEPVNLWGDGEERREFLYIDDVVEVIYRLTTLPDSGTINLVSGVNYTYADALQIISALCAKPPQVRSRPRSKPKVDHGFDNRRLTDLLPGLKFTTLANGLRRVLDTAVSDRQGESACGRVTCAAPTRS